MPKGRFVASTAQNPPLPREFENSALQELLAHGTANGRVDAESFRPAYSPAPEGDPRALKAGRRACPTAGVEIGGPAATKVAAAPTGSAATKTEAGAKAPAAKGKKSTAT